MSRFAKFIVLLMVCQQNGAIQSSLEDSKIQGGIFGDIKDFPFLGRLQIPSLKLNTSKIAPVCTTSLVAWNTAITAGHCLMNVKPTDKERPFITMGVTDCTAEHDPLFQMGRVKKIILHEKFQHGLTPPIYSRYDIAAMHFEKPMAPSPTVKLSPLIPPDFHPLLVIDEIIKSKAHCVIAGWGTLNKENPKIVSRYFRVASFDLISKLQCCTKYVSARYDYCMKTLGALSGYHCFVRVVVNTSITQGDSGAPIVCPYKKKLYVVGTTAAGFASNDPPPNGTVKVYNPTLRIMESVMTAFIHKVNATREQMGNRYEKMIGHRLITLMITIFIVFH